MRTYQIRYTGYEIIRPWSLYREVPKSVCGSGVVWLDNFASEAAALDFATRANVKR